MRTLIGSLRPGSRTLVCQPADQVFLLDLARHGFRLMPVHHDEAFLQDLRKVLREEGLSSQLMGSTRADVSEVPSLARDFYELIILCPQSQLTVEQLRFALGPGGTIVRSRRAGRSCDLPGFVQVTLPEGFEGFRLQSG